MNYISAAGQRDLGQFKPAEGVLLTAFAQHAFKTMHTQQIEFLRLARMTKKCGDNFIPEKFHARRNDDLPEGCLDRILRGNQSGVQKLQESYDALSRNGLLPFDRHLLFSRILEREEQRLEAAEVFYADWQKSRGILPSQPEHKAA